jgi:predicted AAA+ superfamily ATPase
VPELLNYVRTLIDAKPRRMGQWLFTGSQEAPLMQGITESMAGRAAILQLLPFSLDETPKPQNTVVTEPSGTASEERFERAAGRTADPSTTLRSGRDHTGRGVAKVGLVAGWKEPQVPPLRSPGFPCRDLWL